MVAVRVVMLLVVMALLLTPRSLEAAPAYVPVLQPGDVVPDLPLLDQRGRPLSLQETGGRVTALSFIYTRCGDSLMCPLISAKFARLQHFIDPKRMRLVLVTLDPRFDVPLVLRRYGASFGELEDRWAFAWGAGDVVSELSRRLDIVSTSNGRGGLVHTEALVFLDAQGRIVDRIDGNAWPVDGALAEIQGMVDAPSNPVSGILLALSRGVSAACGGRSGLTLGAMLIIFLATLVALTALARRIARVG